MNTKLVRQFHNWASCDILFVNYQINMILFMLADYLHESYRPEGEVPSIFVFLEDPNPYLL